MTRFAGAQKVPDKRVEMVIRKGFLPAADCAGLVSLIDVHRRPSTITDAYGAGSDFRTSETADLPAALRALGYNLLALPVAAVLVFTAIGPALVFLAVNAVLLGRELTDMAWLRHCEGDTRGNPVPKAERILLGAVVAGMMAVPVVNLVAPLVGAAAGTHLVLRRIGAKG